MFNELSAQIWGREAFQSDYRQLLQIELASLLDSESHNPRNIEYLAIIRLLQSATHFSASSHPQFREAAYRIAISTWKLFGNEYENLREIASFVLGRLGNFPAAHYLYSCTNLSNNEHLPQALWFEIESHKEENSVEISENTRETLTDFQRRLWNALESGISTSVTAPTSAGKSFALQRYIVRSLSVHGGWGLYIVPTRTLINQVSSELLQLIKRFNANNIAISTIPVTPTELTKNSGIYVLTQERLQFLFEGNLDLMVPFRLAIIDEAQSVSDGSRGIILQTVIEQLIDNNPDIQFFFISPQTRNPEIFQLLFNLSHAQTIVERESPVAQNLLLIDCVRRKRTVSVSTVISEARFELGEVDIGRALWSKSAYEKLAYISNFFGKSDKNLIYAGKANSCEKVAELLTFLRSSDTTSSDGSENISSDSELIEFSAFIKEHVHSEYVLADCILRRVAFHYGNMPSIIRKTIEEYFDEGLLNYLACTSTLLQGVNLPAKNLFMFKPSKGNNIPLTSLEFWNLAGRAGRLGRDFEGNIYLINLESWDSQPLSGEKDQSIQSAFTATLTERRQDFINFVQDKGHPSGRSEYQALENTFTKLFNDYRKGKLEDIVERVLENDDAEQKAILKDSIKEAAESVSVPNNVLERNINISAFRQEEMYHYLLEKIRNNNFNDLIPAHPLQSFRVVDDNYRRIFKRIHTYFEKLRSNDGSHNYFAPLAVKWMRGDSLASMIDNAYNFERQNNENVNISFVIRKVMKNIERDLRFRYVKYTNCYIDLLVEAFRQTGRTELIESVPPIPLFLEVGASSQTMISLVGLGLSRTAASIVASQADNEHMSILEIREWFRSERFESLSWSSIIMRELRRVL
jgi:superfamily II DNA/RNA helicase